MASSPGHGYRSMSVCMVAASALHFRGVLGRAVSPVPGGGSLVTLGTSAKPSGSRSAKAYRCSNFWTSVLASEVLGSEFIVNVLGH